MTMESAVYLRAVDDHAGWCALCHRELTDAEGAVGMCARCDTEERRALLPIPHAYSEETYLESTDDD